MPEGKNFLFFLFEVGGGINSVRKWYLIFEGNGFTRPKRCIRGVIRDLCDDQIYTDKK